MKSQVLAQLRSCNRHLRDKSHETYVTFMDVLLRSIDHDEARELRAALLKRDFDTLVMIADRISSTTYLTAGEHRLCNQLSSLVRKYPFPKGLILLNPRDKALKTFLHAEQKCKRVNQRFKLFSKLRSPHEYTLSRARSWIAHVLGPFDLSSVQSECGFGPGASIGVHGNTTNQARKLLAKEWTVTPGAFYYAYAAMSKDIHVMELLNRRPDSPFFAADNFQMFENYRKKIRVVDNNKITFVPKTVKTERTIAVEPLLNGYLQTGVDTYMRKRLKRVGIDLRDQSVNQKLAREGSLPFTVDPLVTLDLSHASDSISTELCRDLLPPDWFDYLNQIRSHSYELGGRVVPFHKFVTMGNGFCFPLETLIFASLCHVSYDENSSDRFYSVYGDDIIVRQSVAATLLRNLKVCGFTVNESKTFLSGPFRESCGADWFEGKDVRPVNLKNAFDSLESIIKFCNVSRSKDVWKDILSDGLDFLESLIPPRLRFVRPYSGQPESALEVPFDVFITSPYARWNRKLYCWEWTELVTSAEPDVRIKRFAGYDVALTRGALTGSISSVPFAERRKTRTKTRRVGNAGVLSTWSSGCSPMIPFKRT